MIKVKVPATSANMGPGFDSMGIALNLYNYFYIEETEKGLNITGCNDEFCNENNLAYRSMLRCFRAVDYKVKGLNINLKSDIPLSRGLGSSASCILGGVLAANEIAGSPLNKEDILSLATAIEGHPDNIAPALFGEMVLSIMDEDKIHYNKINFSNDIKFCALIPDFTLSTKESRDVLPKSISHIDAVFNVSRSSLLVSALMNGNYDLIKYACQDRLHQPYRGSLIANYDEIIKKCKELHCLGVYLSGAGPTIMAILKQEDTEFAPFILKYLKGLPHHWDVIELKPDLIGASIESL
jgi:homoserine kinase